jgi:PKD repeat protein
MYTTTDSSSSFDQSGSVSGTTTTGTTTTNSVAGTNGNTTTTGTTTNSTVTDGTNTATASTPVTSDTTTTTGTDDNVTSGGFGIVKRSSDSSDSEDQVAGYLILGKYHLINNNNLIIKLIFIK